MITQSAHAAVAGLTVSLALGAAAWLVSLAKRDVSIVDSVWSWLILGAGLAYFFALPNAAGALGVLLLAMLWALRLSAYITWRNWGEPEDRRYQAIRARNEPGFAFKSLYLVFGLQSLLAWIASLPLLATALAPASHPGLKAAGMAVVAAGLLFEAIADWQLARFKARHARAEHVMDRGLWRYTRHPNYFGEFCVWWGFFLIGLACGGWWSIVSPILMTVLLLKVSGVGLLEKDLRGRKPGYLEYVRRTNTFFPGPRREST